MENKVTDRRQVYAEALAGNAGSKAFLTDATEMAHIRSVWFAYADAVVKAENALLFSDEVITAVREAITDRALHLLGRDLGTIHVEKIARAAVQAVVDAIDPHEASFTELVRLTEEMGLYEDSRTYGEKLKSPMSERAVRRLREALEDGTAPRRTVKRRES
jgi:hypothetical protein